MPQSVLVPMDESPPARAALEHALSAHPDAEIGVLHVIDTADIAAYGAMTAAPSQSEHAEDRASQLFAAAQQVADDYGVELSTATEKGPPVRVITEFATEHDVDHIVMGSLGRSGLKRLFYGSIAEGVVRRSPVPVTVVG